ncbi:MAG: GDSL-type esterase/lipase family protein [Pseudomonadota bacterium]
MFDSLPRLSPSPLAGLAALVLIAAGCDSDSTTPKLFTLANQCITAPTAANYTGAMSSAITAGIPIRYNVTVNPTRGSLSYDQTTGSYTYTPTTPSRGYRDSFVAEITSDDNLLGTATFEIIFGAVRIMPLGDSITFGVTSSQGSAATDLPVSADAVGYRQRLQERLANDGYQVDFVGSQSSGANAGLADTDHEGIPGDTASDMTARVNTALNTNATDIVLLHAGTNDVNTLGTMATVTPVNNLLTAIRNWTISPANPTVDTLVARIVPSPNATKDGNIDAFNANLDVLMANSWSDLTVVDMNSALNAVTDMTPSPTDTTGLHPNTSGYTKMADAWYTALTSNDKVQRCG